MLVEDDNNLREIYEARLLAEGYEIIAAHDGEEALALAVKEKPDLIISDVMMPKISGFDMLDILRSTPETKDTKVIMMTALGQAEDKSRADKLGADRYLVKSQVTLEDVAKIAREVLEESGGNVPAQAAQPEPAAPVVSPVVAAPVVTPAPVVSPVVAAPDPAPVPEPVAAAPAPVSPDPTPVAAPAPIPEPVAATPAPAPFVTPVARVASVAVEPPAADTLAGVQAAPSTNEEQATVTEQVEQFMNTAAETPQPEAPQITPAPEPSVELSGKKVISPINDVNAKPDLNKLLEDEMKKSASPVISPATSGTNPAAPDTPNDVDPNMIAL